MRAELAKVAKPTPRPNVCDSGSSSHAASGSPAIAAAAARGASDPAGQAEMELALALELAAAQRGLTDEEALAGWLQAQGEELDAALEQAKDALGTKDSEVRALSHARHSAGAELEAAGRERCALEAELRQRAKQYERGNADGRIQELTPRARNGFLARPRFPCRRRPCCGRSRSGPGQYAPTASR